MITKSDSGSGSDSSNSGGMTISDKNSKTPQIVPDDDQGGISRPPEDLGAPADGWVSWKQIAKQLRLIERDSAKRNRK